jgi:hypothetical protein
VCRRAWRLALALVVGAAATASGAPPAPGKQGALAPPVPATSRDTWGRVPALRAAARAAHKPAAVDTLRLVALRIDFPDLAFGQSPPADELHDRFYYQNQFRYV